MRRRSRSAAARGPDLGEPTTDHRSHGYDLLGGGRGLPVRRGTQGAPDPAHGSSHALVVGGYREASQLVSVPDRRDPTADRRGFDAAASLRRQKRRHCLGRQRVGAALRAPGAEYREVRPVGPPRGRGLLRPGVAGSGLNLPGWQRRGAPEGAGTRTRAVGCGPPLRDPVNRADISDPFFSSEN